MVKRILLADDDERLARIVSRFLTRKGYELEVVSDGAAALSALGVFRPDVLISDVKMPGVDGFRVLAEVQSSYPDCAVVMMTGYGSVEDAGKAKQLGAVDYLQKPFPPQDLVAILERLEKTAARAAKTTEQFPEIVGDSPPMREVFSRILQVSNSDMAVLIQGETGTGKELVATAIHRLSFRSRGPFVSINCATLEHELFESELFGHDKGAFTGATVAKEGLMPAANGGTIFLDEVGEISKKSQAKLLRAIETGRIRRLGETKERQVDVRPVAATNVPLRRAASTGDFRSDLYFRLAAFTIVLPPLRERREDIPALARALNTMSARADRREVPEVTDRALTTLMEYDWPGNVRELQNVIRSAALACVNDNSNAIDARHLSLLRSDEYGYSSGRLGFKDGAPIAASATPQAPVQAKVDISGERSYRSLRDELISEFDQQYFTQLLTKTQGNISKAARIAGLDRKRLREKLNSAGLSAEQFR